MPPRYPSPRPGGQQDPQGAPWPGLIPLRPLSLGEIYSAAFRLVRVHLVLLGSVAFVGSLLSAGVAVLFLAAQPAGADEAADAWYLQLDSGVIRWPPGSVLWPILSGGIISFICTTVVSGLATALAADNAIGRSADAGAAFRRLGGRLPVLVAVSLLVAVLVFLGFATFIIPGLFVLACLLLATPITVLEKASPLVALRRSVQLSSGFRGRIFGVAVLAYLITSLISSMLLTAVPASTTVAGSIPGLLIQAVLSALTVPWTAAVVALLYIDTRMRKENLAATLIRASMR